MLLRLVAYWIGITNPMDPWWLPSIWVMGDAMEEAIAGTFADHIAIFTILSRNI